MYILSHFAVTDERQIYEFIDAHGFGELVSVSRGRLIATHLPVYLSDDKTRLYGHIARQNPQALDIEGQEVLVTLLGPHDYISPAWYTSPGVPTWNYQAVHLYGQCAVLRSPERVAEIVERLTSRYEARLPDPWQPAYCREMLNAIVGLKITISEIECKFKLSQNRSGQDRLNVIQQLKALGSQRLAEAMARNES